MMLFLKMMLRSWIGENLDFVTLLNQPLYEELIPPNPERVVRGRLLFTLDGAVSIEKSIV